jgi:methylmalonyl-CoA epimerase
LSETFPFIASKHGAQRIDHVGLAVRDIDAVTRFYVDELGLQPDPEPVELSEQKVLVQFLHAGDTGVELLMPLADFGPLPRFIVKRGEGLHHVCFAVGDIHGSVDRLKHRGIVMVDDMPWRSPHGWAAYIHPASAYGCAIELREHYR